MRQFAVLGVGFAGSVAAHELVGPGFAATFDIHRTTVMAHLRRRNGWTGSCGGVT